MHTGLVHSLDFNRDGKTLGHLSIPFSVDRSPYFQVKIPICLHRSC
jgi:predicted deacylase